MKTHVSNRKDVFGLVLTGGGARGAYQSGVLRGISQILSSRCKENPFQVITGSSAGAINSGYLACGGGSFSQSCLGLSSIWEKLQFSDIYKTNTTSLGQLGMRWAGGLTFGGLGLSAAPNYLLDTRPLANLIKTEIKFENLKNYENKGGILAINTTHYRSGAAVTFYSKSSEINPWYRSRRLAIQSIISHEHILASSAIPLLFAPVKIGNTFFGDGAVRMKAPLSSAIHLGASKILAVGVKKPCTAEESKTCIETQEEGITLADIGGTILSSVFLDALDSDLERLRRINRTIAAYQSEISQSSPLRQIDVLAIQPSQDLGELAKDSLDYFPKTVKYLLGGLGTYEEKGSDLISYLSFHPSYTKPLIQLGMSDAREKEEEILSFFGLV